MLAPEVHPREEERLDALLKYTILDSLPEHEYDNLTRIASLICGTPIALISLIDDQRQWFKSKMGLCVPETHRDISFCGHAIHQEEIMVVRDARKDIRFHDNPLTKQEPNVVFYAGAPIRTPDGLPLGTLCVIDNKPRDLSDSQKKALQDLAKQVMILMEFRRVIRVLFEQNIHILKLNEQLNEFAHSFAHELKTPVRNIQTMLDWLVSDYKKSFNGPAMSQLNSMQENLEYLDEITDGMLLYHNCGTMPLEFEEFELSILLDQVEAEFLQEPAFDFKKTACKKKVFHAEEAWGIIFKQLLQNSLEFNQTTQAEIKLHFSENEEEIFLRWEDNGPGIPEKYREKVLELFFTLENHHGKSEGIGLAIVSTLVQRLQGKLVLVDRKANRQGFCLEITLPKKEPPMCSI
jgi:signal transduction histidine kinase